MNKVNRLSIKVDDQLLELIKAKGEGKGLSAKIRSLLIKAIGVELTYKEIN